MAVFESGFLAIFQKSLVGLPILAFTGVVGDFLKHIQADNGFRLFLKAVYCFRSSPALPFVDTLVGNGGWGMGVLLVSGSVFAISIYG